MTRYQNEDRWVTEAAQVCFQTPAIQRGGSHINHCLDKQIGDVGSAAGFLGTWTGNNHDIDDPAGPTWLWKVADVSEMPQGEGTKLMNALFAFPEFMDDAFVGGDEDDDEDNDDEEDGDEDEDEDDEDEEMEDGDEDDSEGMSSGDDSDSDESSSSLPPLIPIYQQPVTSLSDLD